MSRKIIPTLLIAIFAISILATAYPAQVAKASTQPGELRVSTTQFYDFAVIKIAVYDPDGISTDTWELWKDGTKIISNLTKYATLTDAGEYVVYLVANGSTKKTMIYPLQYKFAKAVEQAEAELTPAYKYCSKAVKAVNPAYNGTLTDIDGDDIDDYVINVTYSGYDVYFVDLYADYATNVGFDNDTIKAHPEKMDWLIWNGSYGKNFMYLSLIHI